MVWYPHRVRHSSHSALLTLLKHHFPNQQCTSGNEIIQEILLLEKGETWLQPGAELTPGRQVAADGHTLQHMAVSIVVASAVSALIMLLISTVEK